MKKIVLATLLVVCAANLSAAQEPSDYPKNEFFIGYSFESADINSLTINPGRAGLHGINLEYTRNLNRVVGLTADFSGHIKRESLTVGGVEFEHNPEQYNLMGGLQFKARNQSRVAPFAHALIGVGFFRGFSAVRAPASNTYFFDDARAVSMAFGGGLDIRMSKRVAIRAIQADYNPTFFGAGRQNNFRFSFGVVFTK